jgi:hypothetical protein
MIRIMVRQRQRIAKNRCRFVKGNFMFSDIPRFLAWVPFKIHSVNSSRIQRKTAL